MLTEVFYLHEKGSLADARLCTYILDDSDSIAIEKRPMMLICPGGGYEHTSDRDAEPPDSKSGECIRSDLADAW